MLGGMRPCRCLQPDLRWQPTATFYTAALTAVCPHLPPTPQAGSRAGPRARRSNLSTRKENMWKQMGLPQPPEQEQEAQLVETWKAELASLSGPRPLDLLIKPGTSAVVITGPNTGGKTAAMKALGLSVCMARAGLMMPADEPAKLPCFSAVLADIGDEQSLTASLSTFSGHLRRIQAARGEADGKALLLLDELGTGGWPQRAAAGAFACMAPPYHLITSWLTSYVPPCCPPHAATARGCLH